MEVKRPDVDPIVAINGLLSDQVPPATESVYNVVPPPGQWK